MSAPSPPHLADHSQRLAALDVTMSCVVEAPAGSGKTGLLIQRYLKLLAIVDDPSEVLALTFTRKATGEMRARVLEALTAAQGAAPVATAAGFEQQTRTLAAAVLERDQQCSWHLLQRPHLLNIRTLDALCSTIARAVPLLSGTAATASPVEDAEPLYRRAARAVMLRLGGDDPALNAAAKTLLTHRDGNLDECIRVLAEMLGTREQWGSLIPLGAQLDDATLEIVVLPRLNESMRRAQCAALKRLHTCFPEDQLCRVAALTRELAVADDHDGHVNAFAPCAQLSSSPGHDARDFDHWLIVAKLLLTNTGTWRKRVGKSDLKVSVRKEQQNELLDAISQLEQEELSSNSLKAKTLRPLLHGVRSLPPAEYPVEQWRVSKALFWLLQQALVELRLLFDRDNVCDFTEVALAARTALQSGEMQVALGTKLRHLLVDEMQDSSSSQYDLLQTLTEGWDGQTQTIFLVGDPKQSIYLFRQARVERFQQCMTEGRLGDVTLRPLRLSANFRSGSRLVEQFNAVFEQVFPQEHASSGDIEFAPAVAVLPGSSNDGMVWHGSLLAPFKDPATKVRQRHAALQKEARGIADIIVNERRARPNASIAVLTRARTHVIEVAKVFADLGIPYRAVNIDALNERQEVLDIVAITRALLHPSDRTAWLAVMRAPWCGLGLADLHTLSAGDMRDQRKAPLRLLMRARADLLQPASRERVLRTLDVMDAALLHTGVEPLAHRVERTWRSLGGDACTNALGRENVHQFLRVLDSMAADNETVTLHTLEHRLQRLFAETASTPGAVDVMTIHKAKGLEWDVVFLPGMHRQGAQDGMVALDWLELPDEADDATHDVLLAPLPQKGEVAGTVYSFIRSVRAQRTHAELKRLFYVAATRARRSLHLFAAPEADKEGKPVVSNNSLLKAAGAAIDNFAFGASRPYQENVTEEQEAAVTLSLAAAEDTMARPVRTLPRIERLSAAYDPLEHLRRQASDLPTLAGTPPRRVLNRPQGTFGARAVGNVIHGFVERFAKEWQQAQQSGGDQDSVARQLTEQLSSWTPAVRAALRSGGLSPNESARATKTVLRALETLTTSAEGRWILQPHRGAESESTWRALQDDALRRIRLDRSFFAGNKPLHDGADTLWIVDFKTADRTAREQDAFLSKEWQTYRSQLEGYGKLRSESLPADTPIMLALSYPLMNRFIYWPYGQGQDASLGGLTSTDTKASPGLQLSFS